MIHYSSFYEILDVPEDSSADEIKSAFRKLAMVHHPDKNKNSPESQAKFILLSNAHTILVDQKKRNEYDNYLRNSILFRNQKKRSPGTSAALMWKGGDDQRYNKTLLDHFNFLLWEIEDFIKDRDEKDWSRKYNHIPLRQYILMILAFIDKWILSPAGYRDYFMEARRLNSIDPMEYIKSIGAGQGGNSHHPFAGIADYFYDIRKRMDKFLDKITAKNLLQKIPGHEIRLIDCIIEAQNYTIHYLSYLLQTGEESPDHIPSFTHSNSCFEFKNL